MKLDSSIPAHVVAQVQKASTMLFEHPEVKRVWLFGSIAKGRIPDWRSDIDLAVEGLPKLDVFRTWSEIESKLDMDLDLVRIEDADETLRDQIHQYGLLLLDRSVTDHEG